MGATGAAGVRVGRKMGVLVVVVVVVALPVAADTHMIEGLTSRRRRKGGWVGRCPAHTAQLREKRGHLVVVRWAAKGPFLGGMGMAHCQPATPSSTWVWGLGAQLGPGAVAVLRVVLSAG